MNAWSCYPKHGPAHFTVLKTLFIRLVWSVSKTFELMAGPCSHKHGFVPFKVLTNLFVWMLCSHVNTFKFMAGPRSPTSPVTAQLISRRWRIFSFWCYVDIQKRPNERMVVLPQTRSSFIHGVEEPFRLDGIRLFKDIEVIGWAVLPSPRPSSFHGVEKPFRLGYMQPFKNIQVYGWAALPNIPCHGQAHFAASKNHFVLMLWRLSTTFKWTDVRAPPNTVLLISRWWKIFSSGWYKAFQKHSKLRLGCAPPNRAKFLSRCWRIYLYGCSAAL